MYFYVFLLSFEWIYRIEIKLKWIELKVKWYRNKKVYEKIIKF